MHNREIVIFGAGKSGEKFVYQHFEDIKVSCFWDNHKTGEILGYEILRPEEGKKCFIIVASQFYLEIRRQLLQMGYQEFTDFIPDRIFGKKMAVVYGNCHMEVVRLYLERHGKFASDYGFYPFPMVQELKDIPWDFDNVLQHCELFFHQSIRKNNKFGEEYSSEYMRQYLSKSCKIIALPNLYGMPKYLFPQLDMQAKRIGQFAPFFIDRNIAEWIKEGKSLAEIKNLILGGGVYSHEEIKAMWIGFTEKLKEREKEWDIKISDYILANQRKDKLFSDINHITGKTAYEIANRVLRYMGYKEMLGCELCLMDDLEAIVYTDVKEALGLEFDEKYLRKYQIFNGISACEMDGEEYISQMYQYTRFCLANGFY